MTAKVIVIITDQVALAPSEHLFITMGLAWIERQVWIIVRVQYTISIGVHSLEISSACLGLGRPVTLEPLFAHLGL